MHQTTEHSYGEDIIMTQQSHWRGMLFAAMAGVFWQQRADSEYAIAGLALCVFAILMNEFLCRSGVDGRWNPPAKTPPPEPPAAPPRSYR